MLNGDMPSHLKQLPVKSFDVAPGDIIGGMIYVMDKPLGIEEGMIGISLESPQYRAFVSDKIDFLLRLEETKSQDNPDPLTANYLEEKAELQKKLATSANDKEKKQYVKQIQRLTQIYRADIALQKRFKEIYGTTQEGARTNPNNLYRLSRENLIDALLADKIHKKRRHPLSTKDLKNIFLKFSKYHEVNSLQSYVENVGMGGLLFKSYEAKLGIKKNEHFAKKIGKLTKNGDTAYMVKQDGEMLFGGTGPGFRKMLKTNTGKRLQQLANPFVILATGGLSGLIFAGALLGWRASYLRKNRPVSSNSDALTETIATKISDIRGLRSQKIDTQEGTYANGDLKLVTNVEWSECRDLSGRIAGGQDNYTNVIIKVDKHGIPIKADPDGNLLQAKTLDENKKPLSYERVKIDNVTGKTIKEEISQAEYERGMAVSDDSIAGLGESLIVILAGGDRDALGKVGQNKAISPLEKPANGKTHQFFGIDFGKAYKGNNKFIGSLDDAFNTEQFKGAQDALVNLSMLYDNPLREKMKGIYLLAALRGKLPDDLKKQIAKEYETSDPDFAEKLQGYPQSLVDDKSPLSIKEEIKAKNNLHQETEGQNSDLYLIEHEIQKYSDLAKNESNSVKKAEYLERASQLTEVKSRVEKADKKIFDVFANRMYLTPTQIDVLDNIEKLTAQQVYGKSPDGSVMLNHLRVEKKDRVPWQLKKENNDWVLTCEETDPTHLKEITKRLKAYSGFKDVIPGKNLLQIKLSEEQLNSLPKYLTEETVAALREVEGMRTSAKRKTFHDIHETLLKEKAATQKVVKQPKVAKNADADYEVKTSPSISTPWLRYKPQDPKGKGKGPEPLPNQSPTSKPSSLKSR